MRAKNARGAANNAWATARKGGTTEAVAEERKKERERGGGLISHSAEQENEIQVDPSG